MVVAAGMAPGCGGAVSASGYCEKVCECVGCSASQREECTDAIDDAREVAADEGCSGLFEAYFSCVDKETTCTNDQIDADGCESEAEALVECAGPLAINKSACVSQCEESNACPGADDVNCEQGCAEVQELLTTSGCQSEYDVFLVCYSKVPNVCDTTDACNPEADDFVDCVVQFCAANPDSSVCQ